jgi:hypothetical protein
VQLLDVNFPAPNKPVAPIPHRLRSDSFVTHHLSLSLQFDFQTVGGDNQAFAFARPGRFSPKEERRQHARHQTV